ncbi:MAG: hypothetical protein HZB53_17700 [Chloroflexi bacterium]|nr:hypothetical protein [Chloroflexota bacterium]
MATNPLQWKLWSLTNWVPGIVSIILLLFVPSWAVDGFAWAVPVRMSQVFIAFSLIYRSGFFGSVFRGMSWRRLRYMFAGNFAFSMVLLTTTFLHPDKFRFDLPTGWIWLFLYLEEPIWMVLLYREAEKHVLPRIEKPNPLAGGLRFLLAAQAIVLGGAGGMMFVSPAALANIWPWDLAPVTARVAAGFLIAFCIWSVTLAARDDWEEVKFGMQMNLLWYALVLVSYLVFISEVRWDRMLALPFPIVLASLLAALGAAYVWQERRAGA